ncbi:MAG TPA: hypothetical protein VD836_12690, partial [Solirubrobacteraceae bacterium]|nr:hypothetical protein [Solirubrobacteraceae bacterium]
PAADAAPAPAGTAAPLPLEADGLGVAEPELERDGVPVSADEVVAQLPSALEILLARVVAMPVGPSAGEMGALAAVLVRFWRPPAPGL